MNREIIFRGKRIDNGEKVEGTIEFHLIDGDLTMKHKKAFITFDKMDSIGKVYRFVFEVDPETVGQYTGLKDSTGKRIFEGDILEFEDLGEEGYEYKEGFDFINTASVVFVKGRFELENFWSDNSGVMEEMGNDHDEFIGVFSGSKIIGNIHDHPELLVTK